MNGERDQRKTLGDQAEETAIRYLEKRGLVVVHRNWRCKQGEIDAVAREGMTLVIVEVRSRSPRGSRFGSAIEAVDPRKQRKLRQVARVYLQREKPEYTALRFDVVAIDWSEGGEQAITYIQDAF